MLVRVRVPDPKHQSDVLPPSRPRQAQRVRQAERVLAQQGVGHAARRAADDGPAQGRGRERGEPGLRLDVVELRDVDDVPSVVAPFRLAADATVGGWIRARRLDHPLELVAPQDVVRQVGPPRRERVAELGRAVKGHHDLGARLEQGVVRVAAERGALVDGVLDDEREEQGAVDVADLELLAADGDVLACLIRFLEGKWRKKEREKRKREKCG